MKRRGKRGEFHYQHLLQFFRINSETSAKHKVWFWFHHTHTCTHTHTIILSLSHSLIHTHTHTHTCTLTHTCTHAHTHSLTHSHTHYHSLSLTHSLTLTHSITHTHTHAHAHTHKISRPTERANTTAGQVNPNTQYRVGAQLLRVCLDVTCQTDTTSCWVDREQGFTWVVTDHLIRDDSLKIQVKRICGKTWLQKKRIMPQALRVKK